MRKIDLIGQRFGRWKVLCDDGTRDEKRRHIKWLCRCDCGNRGYVSGASLRYGFSTSCGCYKIEIIKAGLNKLPYGESAFNQVCDKIYRNAIAKDREMSLTKEQIAKTITKNCFYCGMEPKQILRNRKGNGDCIHNGIDRIDNSIGYNHTNIVACCKRCNWMKSNMKQDDFLRHIERIYNHSFVK